ncbi:ribosome-binding factor A [Candidatus Parcubacteria bacterium]|nr:ribosome-binding factor A [Candidatus Parcubacteria bacterium]
MSNRILQINELLRQELAALVSREIYLRDGLITVTKVKCSPDLKNASVRISVLPENFSGSALRELKNHNTLFAKELKKKLNLKRIPRFKWEIDQQERYALDIDKVFDEIKKNDIN